MAEVNHFYVEQNTAQTTTSGSYGDVSGCSISGASLAASTKYLLIVRAFIACDSVTNKTYFKIVSADDATVATHTESILEHPQTDADRPVVYSAVVSFSTDGTPADVKAQFMVDGSSTMTVDQFSLLLIDLDHLGSANYYEAKTSTESAEYATSATALETIAAANTGITETWLALGSVVTSVGSTSYQYLLGLTTAHDASSSEIKQQHEHQGEDTAEQRVHAVMSRHKAVSAGVDIDLDASENNASGNHTALASYLIALKTSAFADFESDFDHPAATITTTPGVKSTVASYTPTTAGDHLIIGTIAGNTSADFYLYLADGSTPTRTGDDQFMSFGWAGTYSQTQTMQVVSVSETKTFNTYAALESNTTPSYWANLLVLNLNGDFAAGGTDDTATLTAHPVTASFPAVAASGEIPDVATLTVLPVSGSFPAVATASNVNSTTTLTVHPVTATFPVAAASGVTNATATLTVLAVTGGFPSASATSSASTTLTALPVQAAFPTVATASNVNATAGLTALLAAGTFPAAVATGVVNDTATLTVLPVAGSFPSAVADGDTVETVIRPIADTTGTGWDSAPVGSQDLWAQVDEILANDTDYIYATDPNP